MGKNSLPCSGVGGDVEGHNSSPGLVCSSPGLLASILHLVTRAGPDLAVSAVTVFLIMALTALLSPSGDGTTPASSHGAPGLIRGIIGQPQFFLGLGSRGMYPSAILSPGQAAHWARSYWLSSSAFNSGKRRMVYFTITPDFTDELLDSTHAILRQKFPIPSSL